MSESHWPSTNSGPVLENFFSISVSRSFEETFLERRDVRFKVIVLPIELTGPIAEDKLEINLL